MIAYFMTKYAYKFDEMMDEYAIRIFSLAEHAQRIEAENRIHILSIIRIANSDNDSYEKAIKNYQKVSADPFETENNEDNNGDYDRLISLLGG